MAEIINATEHLDDRIVLNRWVLKGKADSLSLLNGQFSPGQDGCAYLVGSDVYTWDVDTSTFVLVGPFRGPQGLQGERGPQGTSIFYGDEELPGGSVGNDGDLYINHATDLINGIGYRGLYRKANGIWSRIIDLSISTVSTIGMLAFFADPSLVPKRGWLPITGADVGRVAYPGLFGLIGTTFGAGDGSTTFTLPDARARFLRALDLNRGLDLGREFGSTQDCAIENITGNTGYVQYYDTQDASGAFGIQTVCKQGGHSGTSYQGISTYLDIDVSRVVSTADETRPMNIAFPLYICYM